MPTTTVPNIWGVALTACIAIALAFQYIVSASVLGLVSQEPLYYAECNDVGQACVDPGGMACVDARASAWVSSLDGYVGSGASTTWADCATAWCSIVCPALVFEHKHCGGNLCSFTVVSSGMVWSEYWPVALLFVSASVYEYCTGAGAGAIAFCTGECGT